MPSMMQMKILQSNHVQSCNIEQFKQPPGKASQIKLDTYILRQEPMVTVKREYLICDVMALISFIGGVKGTCIGTFLFSLSGETLNFIESAIKWRNSRKCRDIAKEENVNNSLTQFVSTSDFVREVRDNMQRQSEINKKIMDELFQLKQASSKIETTGY